MGLNAAGRWLAVLAIGGIGGALCDHIHVQSGTTVYTNPTWFGQPWYALVNFGGGVLVAYLAAPPFARLVHHAPPSNRLLLSHLAWFLGAYFASALLHPHREIAALVLHGTFLLRAVVSPAPLAVYALLGGAVGTAFEAILAAAGTFHYVGSDLFGVPFWLPALYFHAAPLMLAISARTSRQPNFSGEGQHERSG